jgi:hypothetical protein
VGIGLARLNDSATIVCEYLSDSDCSIFISSNGRNFSKWYFRLTFSSLTQLPTLQCTPLVCLLIIPLSHPSNFHLLELDCTYYYSLTLILLMWRIGLAPNSIPIYIQQNVTLHNLFISRNCFTCFGLYVYPSSGAHTSLSTAPGICHTVAAICRYRGRVGTGLSVLWVAYATKSHSNRFQLF